MVTTSIQDRTAEFRAVLAQAQKKQSSTKGGAQRQSLLTDAQRRAANGSPNGDVKGGKRGARSEFARRAADIGRGITGTMEKLERLAQLAKRKTLFDDRPVEIAELTYVIKQDLSSLNSQISSLQALSRSQHPQTSRNSSTDQEGEHNKNVVVLLQGKLADVSVNFKDVLEVRTKNIQASRSRTENFVSSVSSQAQPSLDPQQSASPLYNTPTKSRTPQPGYQNNQNPDILNLDPTSSSALAASGPQTDQQLLMMEEAQPTNTYIHQRGEAIEAIERTISELGGIFGQLASMVSEQSEMIQRIDANTEDVVDNVQGAQRELMKYWSRVSGNRWLIAKMFGVLMITEQNSTFDSSRHAIAPSLTIRPMMQESQPVTDSADTPLIPNDNVDATGDFLLPASDDKPTTGDLSNAADIPVLAVDGTSCPFQSLYSNSDTTQRVLIIFIRHFFCGVCQEYIRALCNSIPRPGLPPSTSIKIIGCGQASLISKYVQMTSCVYPIYAEPSRKLYDMLGMTSNLSMGSKKPDYLTKSMLAVTVQSIVKTIASGTDALKGGDVKQIGGEFLFEGGEVVWCHRMQNTRDHAEVEVLREVLGLEKEKK
ncbi:MAG: hypothetical protein LQ347_004427 [Umbilicaria vellea]|nr:MAG: hypothetical protein LQ347_004427 [Umbilicaria vellea]